MATAVTLTRRLGRLRPQSLAVLICDVQEKFRPNISFFPEIVSNSHRIMQAAKILDVPILATEQYPKGLGKTVPELELEKFGVVPFPKTCFSMAGVPELMNELETRTRDSVILCGIETHACIYHTTLDLIESGKFDVHVVVDCCSSRSMTDRKFALERLRDIGAVLTTTEAVILGLCPDAAHPKFRQIQKIVMTSASDTGLI